MKNYKGILYAILSSVAFGLMPGFAKFSYQNGSNPTTVLIFRFLLAALLLWIYLKYKKVSLKVEKHQLMLLMATGMIGYTLTTITLFMAYNYLGGGLATTYHFIYPAVVCAVSLIFFKDTLSKRKLISLMLSGLGVYALIAFEKNILNPVGVMIALISGVFYGLTIIALGLNSIKTIDNRVVTMYVSIGGTLGMITYGLVTNSIILDFNIQVSIGYLGIAIVSTISALLLLLKAIELIGAASASILATFEPIVSIIVGILIFGEPLSIALVIGIILIISSTVILARD